MSLIVLIDDVRCFRDGRPCQTARSSASAVDLLRSLAEQRIDELWLDHDLGGDDTVLPVIDLLCSLRFDVGGVWIHSFNARGAVVMHQRLTAAGYAPQHHYDVRIWSHADPKMSDPDVTLGDGRGRS